MQEVSARERLLPGLSKLSEDFFTPSDLFLRRIFGDRRLLKDFGSFSGVTMRLFLDRVIGLMLTASISVPESVLMEGSFFSLGLLAHS